MGNLCDGHSLPDENAELIDPISQRLSMDFHPSPIASGHQQMSLRAFVERQVQNHLRFVTDVFAEDGTLDTVTQSKPLFSFAVEEAMRRSAAHSRRSGGCLLQQCWDAIHYLENGGVTSHKGDQGELTAAVLVLAAKDSCQERLGGQAFCQSHNVFVRVEDLMRMLFAMPTSEESSVHFQTFLAESRSKGRYVNFTHSTRSQHLVKHGTRPALGSVTSTSARAMSHFCHPVNVLCRKYHVINHNINKVTPYNKLTQSWSGSQAHPILSSRYRPPGCLAEK